MEQATNTDAQTERASHGGERIRPAYIAAGVFFVVAFFSMTETASGLDIRLVGRWDYFSPGELNFWLSSVVFLAPAAFFIAAGVAPAAASPLHRLIARLHALDGRERVALALCFGLLIVALLRLGNQLVLLGLPFTDDEYATRFGGQVLASGQLLAELPAGRELLPDLFLFQTGGGWTSMNYLGALLPWALSELSGTGTWIFQLIAAAGVVAVAVACARVWGVAWGAVGGGLFLCSPMVLVLSMTSHGQLTSRSFLAIGLAPLVWADRLSRRGAIVAGVGLGMALLARPVEVGALLAPVGLFVAWRAWRDPALRRGVLLALGVIVAILGVGALYSLAVAGTPLPLRFAANEIPARAADMTGALWDPDRLWPRFGSNLAYNIFSLAIWFLGPLGVILVIAGATVDRWTRVLLLGVALALCLALLHDNLGLHCVGPIHYTEASVPLIFVAMAGLRRLVAALGRLEVPRGAVGTYLLAYCAVAMLLFSGWSTTPLHNQADMQREVYDLVDEQVTERPAIVVAPWLLPVWRAVPEYRENGSWVQEWRRPHPVDQESILIARDRDGAVARAAEVFPDRAIYRLGLVEGEVALRRVR